LLTRTRRRAHISPILKSLHWLPVSFHIDFKILLLVFKALHGLAPRYLSEMLSVHEPVRPLRSSYSLFLTVPKSRTKTFGDAAFSCYTPSRWNSLPEDLRGAENIDIFKHRLKIHLFSLAFMSCFMILYFNLVDLIKFMYNLINLSIFCVYLSITCEAV
ncbi:hypothetical protein LDENG_00004970, partial [Lucifuga dentata]